MGNQQANVRESIPSVYQKIIIETNNLGNGITEVRPKYKITKQRMKQIQQEIVDFKKLCRDILMIREVFKQEKWLKMVGFNLNVDLYARTSGRISNPNVKISKIPPRSSSNSKSIKGSFSLRGGNKIGEESPWTKMPISSFNKAQTFSELGADIDDLEYKELG